RPPRPPEWRKKRPLPPAPPPPSPSTRPVADPPSSRKDAAPTAGCVIWDRLPPLTPTPLWPPPPQRQVEPMSATTATTAGSMRDDRMHEPPQTSSVLLPTNRDEARHSKRRVKWNPYVPRRRWGTA